MTVLPLSKTTKAWLYNISLTMVLVGSLLSYYLADLADYKTAETANLGIYTIVQFAIMTAAMLLVWYLAPKSTKLKCFASLLVVALLARLALIGVAPYTSNDVDRYLFDGRIAIEGMDPYRVSHDDPALAELREIWQPPSEHAAYVTLYPPLALGLFSLSAAAGIEYAQWVFKVLLLLAGILTLLITTLILKKAQKLHHLPLIALSPLLILETGVGLHLDTFSTLAVVMVIFAWQHQRLFCCGLAIGIGALFKILPIMLLLPLFFVQTRFRHALILVMAALLTVVSGYLLMFAIGLQPIGSIGVFFQKWRFASPFFSAFDGQPPILLTLAIGIICSAVIAFFSYKSKNAPLSGLLVVCLQLAVALPLLISPVLFPWYLMPLVPLLALKPNIYLLAWVSLMPLTYEVLGQFSCCNVWAPAQWPVWLLGALYLCTAGKIIGSLIKRKSRFEYAG